jgi:hypothetical protein
LEWPSHWNDRPIETIGWKPLKLSHWLEFDFNMENPMNTKIHKLAHKLAKWHKESIVVWASAAQEELPKLQQNSKLRGRVVNQVSITRESKNNWNRYFSSSTIVRPSRF